MERFSPPLNGYNPTVGNVQQNSPLMPTVQPTPSEESTPVQSSELDSFFYEPNPLPLFEDPRFNSLPLEDQFAMLMTTIFQAHLDKQADVPAHPNVISAVTIEEYLGTLYDSTMSTHDNIIAVMKKNAGYFPSTEGKATELSDEMSPPSDSTISDWYLPKNVTFNGSFSGVGTLHIMSGNAVVTKAGANLAVDTSAAIGRIFAKGGIVTVSNGAMGVIANGGTGIALDNTAILERNGSHPDNRLEARKAGTWVYERTEDGMVGYQTIKDNYVCVGDTPVEDGAYGNK